MKRRHEQDLPLTNHAETWQELKRSGGGDDVSSSFLKLISSHFRSLNCWLVCIVNHEKDGRIQADAKTQSGRLIRWWPVLSRTPNQPRQAHNSCNTNLFLLLLLLLLPGKNKSLWTTTQQHTFQLLCVETKEWRQLLLDMGTVRFRLTRLPKSLAA